MQRFAAQKKSLLTAREKKMRSAAAEEGCTNNITLQAADQ